jgi:hypothetical protein
MPQIIERLESFQNRFKPFISLWPESMVAFFDLVFGPQNPERDIWEQNSILQIERGFGVRGVLE